jgi:biotin/lipoyl-binding protein
MVGSETQPHHPEPQRELVRNAPVAPADPDPIRTGQEVTRGPPRWPFRMLRVLLTLLAVGFAALLTWRVWDLYMGAPWTRDATVRAYVVTMAPEVAGRIVSLPVVDNQYVRKGDLRWSPRIGQAVKLGST